MDLSTQLVVLSACATGLGDITTDGVIGLARAFMFAGVSSVIVSRWNVPTEQTEQIMTGFYDGWAVNPNKAQALRQTILEVKEKNPDNPYHWAGFVLLGEPQ